MLKPRELIEAYRAAGVSEGSTLVVQSSYKGAGGAENGPGEIIQALLDVIGKTGTLLMPAYNFKSWTENHYFDSQETPSKVGVIPETFRLMPGVRRTKHPIHSLSVYGKLQKELCSIDTHDSFGPDSVFARLLEVNATYSTLGLGVEMPFLPCHLPETELKVPYRRPKSFSGIYVDEEGAASLKTYSFWVRRTSDTPPTDKIYAMQCERGIVRKQPCGQTQIFACSAKDYHQSSLDFLRELKLT